MELCEETETGDLECPIPEKTKYTEEPDDDAGSLDVPSKQVKGREPAFEDVESI